MKLSELFMDSEEIDRQTGFLSNLQISFVSKQSSVQDSCG